MISTCLQISWADIPATRAALTTALDIGKALLGYLFALATQPDTPLAFNHWRAAPEPPHPGSPRGPLDGLVMDYMIKAHAASGIRAPTRHGTHHFDHPDDRHLLAQHGAALGRLLSPVAARATPPPDDPY